MSILKTMGMLNQSNVTGISDGVICLVLTAILSIVLFMTAVLFRRTMASTTPDTSQGGFYNRLTLLFFAVLGIIILCTYRTYGISFDEPAHQLYGEGLLTWIRSGFRDWSFMKIRELYLYGGFFDTLVATITSLTPNHPYETRHLLTAMAGFVGIIGCSALARFLAGPRCGFFAAVLLTMIPSWFGHMFMNPKDIPFATGMVWSLYFLIRSNATFPRVPPMLTLMTGISFGLTMGIRVGGLIVIGYSALAVWLRVLAQFLQKQQSWRRNIREFVNLHLTFLLPVTILSYSIMLIFWAWALCDPFRRPFIALSLFTHFKWNKPVLFQGLAIPADQLPLSYLPTMFLVKIPEIMVLFGIVAILCGIVALYRSTSKGIDSPLTGWILVAAAIVVPFCYTLYRGAVLYDGLRHFLFFLPPLVCIMAYGLNAITQYVSVRSVRITIGVLVAVWLVVHMITLVALHPYEYVYYNGFVGGVQGAEDTYELDYWGTSYRETVMTLVETLQLKMGNRWDTKKFLVGAHGFPLASSYYFPQQFSWTNQQNKADFFLSFTRWNLHKNVDGKLRFTVGRMGIVFNTCFDRRMIKKAKKLTPR